MGYSLITNWKPRQLQCLADLPEKARAEFDYVDEDDAFTPRFANYRGEWVDCFDTQRIEARADRSHPVGWACRVHPGEPFALFDAIISDSYFSGIVIRFADDDSVILGRYYS